MDNKGVLLWAALLTALLLAACGVPGASTPAGTDTLANEADSAVEPVDTATPPRLMTFGGPTDPSTDPLTDPPPDAATGLLTDTAVLTATAATPTPGLGVAQIASIGNLRSEPFIDPATVLGQVCPGDQVALLGFYQQAADDQWWRVRVQTVAADCSTIRASIGTEGWMSTILLAGVPPVAATTVASAPTVTPPPTATPTPVPAPTVLVYAPRSLPAIEGRDITPPAAPINGETAPDMVERTRWGIASLSAATFVAFSPDGQTLVTDIGQVGVRETLNGTMQYVFEGQTAQVNSMVFSPDGQTIASADANGTARLWQASDGTLLRVFPEAGPGAPLSGNASPVNSVAFFPDGERLLTGSNDGSVRVWRLVDPTPTPTVTPDLTATPDPDAPPPTPVPPPVPTPGPLLFSLPEHTEPVLSVAAAPDGLTFASGGADNIVRLWRASDAALLFTLEGHTEQVNSVAFSPDSQVLASASSDDTVRLWRVSDGALLLTLGGHTNDVLSVAFSPDGAVLASASAAPTASAAEGDTPDEAADEASDGDEALRLWRVSDGSLIYSPGRLLSGITDVAFSPDGNFLATISRDRTLRLWGLPPANNTPRPTLSMPAEIITGENSQRVIELARWTGHQDAINSVDITPDGLIAASTSDDNTMQLWNVQDGLLRYRPMESRTAPRAARFDPDGALVALAADEMQLWRVAERTQRLVLPLAANELASAVAFSPDEQVIATGLLLRDPDALPDDLTASGTAIKLWRSTGLLVATLDDTEDAASIRALVVTPDSRTFANTAGSSIQVRRVTTGEVILTIETGAFIEDLAISPDGATLAAAGRDAISLWQVRDGAAQGRLAFDTEEATSVAFAPVGDLLAAGLSNGDIALWQVADNSRLFTLRGHSDMVRDLSFSADSRLLLSGSLDATVRVWGVAP